MSGNLGEELISRMESDIELVFQPHVKDSEVSLGVVYLYLKGDGLEYTFLNKGKIERSTIEASDFVDVFSKNSDPTFDISVIKRVLNDEALPQSSSLDEGSKSAVRKILAERKQGYPWRTRLSLLTMAASTLTFGTNEFVVAGLLPQLADTFSVSIPTAGWTTSAFILGVGVSAPVLAVVTNSLKRKYVLCSLTGGFALATVAAALSQTYPMFLLFRVIQSFGHGTFFCISPVTATSMVQSNKRASAVALVFSGLAASNVLGVPLGTEVGLRFGWRTTYWCITGLAVLSTIGMHLSLPENLPLAPPAWSRHTLTILKKPDFWLAFFASALGFSGKFTSYTYVANMMEDVAGFADSDLTWLTALFGIGTVIGNMVGGKAADKALMPAVYGSLFALLAVLVAFIFTSHYRIPAAITLFLLGLSGFSSIAPLMHLVMSKAPGAETLGSTMSILGFAGGVALGVSLAGLTIDKGFGYDSPNWVGGSLTGIGLLCAIFSGLCGKKAHSSSGHEAKQLGSSNSEELASFVRKETSSYALAVGCDLATDVNSRSATADSSAQVLVGVNDGSYQQKISEYAN